MWEKEGMINKKARIEQLYKAYGDVNYAFDEINKIVQGITDDSMACILLLEAVCKGAASICGLCGGDSLCKAENKQQKRICADFSLKGEEGEDDNNGN
jgi:hypothetical protein